jgi:hypothetical protein
MIDVLKNGTGIELIQKDLGLTTLSRQMLLFKGERAS